MSVRSAMAARTRTRSPLLTVAIIAGVLGAYLTIAPNVEAHCPGGVAGYRYSRAEAFPTARTGIRGWIGYVNANPCTNNSGNAFSAHWLGLSRNSSSVGFVQVGMMKRQGWSLPRHYCEFVGNDNGFGHLHDATTSLSATTHHYRFSTFFSEGTTQWECQVDGAPKFHTHTVGELGWSSGTMLQVAGEAYTTHGQIGANAPSKLGYTVLQSRSGSTWSTTNYGLVSPPAPYGNDEPASGEFRNWTNAH